VSLIKRSSGHKVIYKHFMTGGLWASSLAYIQHVLFYFTVMTEI